MSMSIPRMYYGNVTLDCTHCDILLGGDWWHPGLSTLSYCLTTCFSVNRCSFFLSCMARFSHFMLVSICLGCFTLTDPSDIPDGGASHFAETVREIKKRWVTTILPLVQHNIRQDVIYVVHCMHGVSDIIYLFIELSFHGGITLTVG